MSAIAPVNEPRVWPNSSDSRTLSVSAPQLIGTNGREARRPFVWIARATSSFPVPLSPTIRTGAAALAAWAICLYTASMPAVRPMRPAGGISGCGRVAGAGATASASARSTVAFTSAMLNGLLM